MVVVSGVGPQSGQRICGIKRILLLLWAAWVLQAAYVYDGANDRLQQVDGNSVAHTGATPVTTTYTNDVVGLTQVLVADDGTSRVVNLFGLDLVKQDSGAEVRTLLGDGLGSVRLEMVGASSITIAP